MPDLDKTTVPGFVERIEEAETEKSHLNDDIKDIYDEFKVAGGDPKALRKVIVLRKMERDEREELEASIDAYMEALGDV